MFEKLTKDVKKLNVECKDEVKKINVEFKGRISIFLKYQIATKILLAIVIIPIFYFMINLLMVDNGVEVLTNYEMIQYGFSKQGILSLILLYILAITIILIEVGGIIVTNNELIATNKEPNFYSILGFCLKKVPKFIELGGILAILFFMLFISFNGIQLYDNFGIPVMIPPFIQTYIDESTLYTVMQLLLIVILFVLSTRWIFSLHFILLENKRAKDALKESNLLIKRNFKKFIIRYFLVIIGIFIFFGVLYTIYSGITLILANVISFDNSYLVKIIIYVVFIINEILGIALSFITVPVLVYYMSRLFYLLKEEDEIKSLNLKSKKRNNIAGKVFSNKKNIIILFVITFLILGTLTSSILIEVSDMKYDVKITAHKGNVNEAVENTVEAVETAINHGADYAEIDVQLSKDNQVFLCHDTNLKRLTGVNQNTSDLTYGELKELDLSYYGDGKLKGNKIPLLNDIIKKAKGKIKLNIELKVTNNNYDLADKVIQLIEENNLENECVVSSLDYEVLQRVKKLNPRIKTGYIMFLAKGDIKKLNVDFYSVEETTLTDEMIYDAHSVGKEVHVWTVNESEGIEDFINRGVDNIITDQDLLAKEILKQLKYDNE